MRLNTTISKDCSEKGHLSLWDTHLADFAMAKAGIEQLDVDVVGLVGLLIVAAL